MPSPSSAAPAAGGRLSSAPPRPTVVYRRTIDTGFQYELAGMLDKAIACYEDALAVERAPAARAEVYLRLARVHRTASAWDAAVRTARTAAQLALDAGERDLAAEAMNAEVGVYQLRGDFAEGDALAERALAVADGARVRGLLLQNRGAIAAQRGDFAAADALFADSVAAFSAVDYEYGIAVALTNGAAAARDGGNPARAVELGRQAIEITRRLDALDLLGLALLNQAHALADRGDVASAEELLGEAYGHFTSTNNPLRQAECLEVMGAINVDHPEGPGSRETAVRCLTRARHFADRVGALPLRERVQSKLEGIRSKG